MTLREPILWNFYYKVTEDTKRVYIGSELCVTPISTNLWVELNNLLVTGECKVIGYN